MKPDGTTALVPVPLFAETRGILDGQMLFTLREEWAAPDGKTYPQGALLAFDYDKWLAEGGQPTFQVLFEPTERTAIESVATTKGAAFVSVLDNVRGRVYAYRYVEGAWTNEPVKLPENGAVAIADADSHSDVVMFNYEDFLTPDSLFWSFDAGATVESVKSMPARFAADGREIVQYEATSKDGTKIPYFVVGPKDRAGPTPTLLYAYGGFQVSTTPWYAQIAGKLWVERGNTFVVANIRGGGEFGPRWHEAGLKTNRQRVYDDFIAVAEDLIAKGITTPKQLGIQGGFERRAARGRRLHAAPGPVQRGALPGAALGHDPLHAAAARRLVDRGIRRPGRARGARGDREVLAVPEPEGGRDLSARLLPDLDGG